MGVVIATRNRVRDLTKVLEQMVQPPDRPPVVVVDNASSDDTAESVAAFGAPVTLLRLDRNLGAAARNAGVRHLETPYVAFSDDDSWWAPGALAEAAALFDAYPSLGLIAARVLVGERGLLDPVSAAMAESPLVAGRDLPGPPVLGFVACGAVVRRHAFLGAGGFERRYGVGGEEHLLSLDLAAAGWDLAYVEQVVAHHHPSAADRNGRRRRELRNAFWSTWLRRPAIAAAAHTLRLLSAPDGIRTTGLAFAEAVAAAPWCLRQRHVVPPAVERGVRRVGGPGL